MNTKYSMGGGALFAALLTSTASFADVTPQEVWDVYKGYMTSYGYTLEADESTSDGVLTISGLSMTMALPEESGELTLSMGDFGFLDQGDGSVLVTLPSVMPINIHVTPTDDEVGDMKLELATSEFSMVASGTIDDMNFATSIGDMSFTLKELVSGGEVMIQATAAINAHKVVSNSTVKSGDLRSFVNDLTIGKFDYSINVTDPDSASEFMMRGETVDLKMASATSIPAELDMEDVNAALQGGFSVHGTLSSGAGNSESTVNEGQQTFASNTSSTGIGFEFAMNADAIKYGVGSTGMNVSVRSSEIPLPVSFTLEDFALSFLLPVAKSDTPSDFSTLIKLAGFAPNNMIWGILDPTAQLPRDPATIILDVSGSMNWLFDILDMEQQAALNSADVPAEIHSMQLNNLTVSAAGAELTGNGSFVFNNDDLETFDGFPAPDGSVDLKVVGANGLIDTLIKMGLLREEDAMGARMMMGLFGRPGEGDDTVLSTIEVKPNGQVLANGQRLQ